MYKFLVFALFIGLASCSSSDDKKDTKKKEKEPLVKDGVCRCDNLILDAKYNHFYIEDRKKPYTGKCQMNFSNGNLSLEKNFQEGKMYGVMTEWYENGNIKTEREFVNNLQHGIFKEFHEDGTIKYHAKYEYGDVKEIIERNGR